MKRFDFEKFDRDLDAQLLRDEAILAEEKTWAEHDDSDLLADWVHRIIETKDIGDFGVA